MRISKRSVDALEPQERDYFVWDEDLPGFGVRVYASGRKSYLVQYRKVRRSRRLTLGFHGELTPEVARREAKVLLGQIATGSDPAEEKRLNREGMTVRELCERYMADAEIGLVPGKRRLPKKASTLASDRSRIDAHILPLLGARLVKEIGRVEVNEFLRDVARGSARRDRRTKARGRSIVRGGLPTATRTVGLLGGILTYAVRNGIIDANPVHGVAKPAGNIRDRRLCEAEYKQLGEILRQAERDGHNRTALEMIRLLALTGCRRGEVEKLKWVEVDERRSCFRFADTKEGPSVRPIGSPAFKIIEERRPLNTVGHVFPGAAPGKPFDGLPKVWQKAIRPYLDITPHGLRHSFASMADDLGYSEATTAALLGHSAGSFTGRHYIHKLDAHLIAAAEAVSARIAELLGASEDLERKTRDLFASWASVAAGCGIAAE